MKPLPQIWEIPTNLIGIPCRSYDHGGPVLRHSVCALLHGCEVLLALQRLADDHGLVQTVGRVHPEATFEHILAIGKESLEYNVRLPEGCEEWKVLFVILIIKPYLSFMLTTYRKFHQPIHNIWIGWCIRSEDSCIQSCIIPFFSESAAQLGFHEGTQTDIIVDAMNWICKKVLKMVINKYCS